MPAGFFDVEDVPTVRGDEKINAPAAPKKLGCVECGLKLSCVTPHLPSFGRGTNGIMVVVEHPTQDDDRRGKLLTGDTGIILREWFRAAGLDLDDCTVVSALECAPGEGGPTGVNYAACRRFLLRKVDQAKPKVIIPIGKGAVDGLLGARMTGRLKGLTIDDWVGITAPDQELNAWVCPTWSPSIYMQMNEDVVVDGQVIAHLEKAAVLVDKELPRYDWRSRVKTIHDPEEAVKIMVDLRGRRSWIAHDHETTGIKPHRDVHKLYTTSLSDGETAWAFPFHAFMKHSGFVEAHKKLLTSPHVKVIAHNGKFEGNWSHEKEGFWPRLDWDTQIAAHSIHNRKKVNLKFCVYANFGVAGYDDSIDPYLSGVAAEVERYGANALNQIERAPLEDVLVYNAGDSLFTYWLKEVQEASVSDHVLKGIRFFTEATTALAKVEDNGIYLNQDEADRAQQSIGDTMDEIEQDIQKLPDLKGWHDKGLGPFRPSAAEDLITLLFDIMKLKPTKKTAPTKAHPEGQISTDKEALEPFEYLPVVENVLAWKKLQKMRDTYITGFLREGCNGIIHPSFSLSNVDTFRPSTSDPNFANIPKRDKKTAVAVRRLLKGHPGHRLCEYDYKQAEVVVSSCYNKDPNLIEYVSDFTKDMHRDVGQELFFRTADTLLKDERHLAKNGFVFAEFYGDYYEQIAVNIWHKMGAVTKKRLAENDIETLADFLIHVRDIEADFWDRRFPVYKAWKKKEYNKYLDKGIIKSYTGFEYQGPMRRNQVINYPTQGSAFHCTLRTLIKVGDWLEENNMKSKIVNQIYDALVISVHPDEQDDVDYQVWWFGTQEIRKAWSWLIVPMHIEKSMSPVDGSWADVEELGLLTGKRGA